MRKALIVVHLTVKDMMDHEVATTPTPAQQVAFAEGFQRIFNARSTALSSQTVVFQ